MKLNNNIRQTFRVAKIELSSMFYSPVAWLVLIIFALLIGYDYANVFDNQLRAQSLDRELWNVSSAIYNSWMTGILKPILRNLYLYIPLITMGLMSREYQSGSIKLLYSSPVKNSSIILGKYLAMMCYGAALMSIIGLNVLFSWLTVENFQISMLLVGMLGIYLLILAYSAIGLFMSTLTAYQVVAAVGTLAVLAVLNFIGDVGQNIDFVRDITFWLSIYGRAISFIEGLLPSADVMYFLIVIGLFLSLSVLKLNTEKKIMSLRTKILKYSTIIVTALLLGYLTSLPEAKLYYDGTYTKSNTLSPESQEVMKKLTQPLTITTYVNILAPDYFAGLPFNRNWDFERFERYVRFKPDIKMKYVYYYHHANNPDLDAQYPNMTDEERAKALCKISDLNFKMFKSPEEIDKIVDLSGEGYQFVRVAEQKDGKKAFLRLFNDNQRHPRETEITAMLKRFVAKAPMVAFSKGYGSRSINNYGGRDFYLFAKDLWFRNSLLNQGFDTREIDLDNEKVSDDISVLVISDLREPLSEKALANVKDFMARGGNMMILGEYGRSENMNRLTASLGVRFSDGVLACPNELNSPVVLRTTYTEEAVEKHSIFATMRDFGYGVSVPSSLALDYSEVKDFEVYPVLETSDKAWIEYETKDLVDGDFICNAEAGEKEGVYATLIYLRRKVGDKEQRIVVSGDSDFITNEEFGLSRPGMEVNNMGIISGSFRWLSNDVFPIDTERIAAIDNRIDLSSGWRFWIKLFFMVLFPLFLAISGISIIYRRQRK